MKDMHYEQDKYLAIIYCHSRETYQSIADELSKINIESVYTSSCQSLLLKMEEQDNYIVLAEYLMPLINGVDLIDKIKTTSGFLPPITFMLNTSEKDVIKKLGKLGVQDFIYFNEDFLSTINDRVVFQISKLTKGSINSSFVHKYSNENFYHLFNDINDFVIIRDMNEKFVFVNDSFLKKSNYNKDEILQIKTSKLIAPQEIYNYYLEIRILKDKRTHTYETLLISKDYKLIPVEVSSKMTIINKQEVIVSIARDISNRKETKDQLKKLNHDLEQMNNDFKSQNDKLRNINREIEENRHALKLALQEAENAEKLKNNFLANMSHEIRTPMNAIVGFSQLLEDADLEDIPSFVRIINANSETLLQLINDLMDIAKIESDLVAINTEQLSMHELLLDIETIYKYEKKNKGKNHIFIKYNRSNSNDCIIETDKLRLKQVLMNLMNNALKFTEEGTIEFGFTKEENHVKIYVKDTGIGIPLKMQQQIFERFRQLDEEAKPQGTGIGLSISRSLMRLLGGDISLESDATKGSVFHLKHPIKQDKNSRVKPPQKNMVLIAEDEEDNFHLLKYIVKDLNLDVIWAKNGQEAIDYCNEKPVSLILMDIKMPSVGGLEATRKILEINPDIPIIAQTAYTQDDDRRRCREAGCVEFISKPINLTTLRRTIAKYV